MASSGHQVRGAAAAAAAMLLTSDAQAFLPMSSILGPAATPSLHHKCHSGSSRWASHSSSYASTLDRTRGGKSSFVQVCRRTAGRNARPLSRGQASRLRRRSTLVARGAGATEHYSWTEGNQYIDLMVEVAPTCRAKDIDFCVTKDSLRLGQRGSPSPLVSGVLRQGVAVSDCTWTLDVDAEERKWLCVTLQKLCPTGAGEEEEDWEGVLEGEVQTKLDYDEEDFDLQKYLEGMGDYDKDLVDKNMFKGVFDDMRSRFAERMEKQGYDPEQVKDILAKRQAAKYSEASNGGGAARERDASNGASQGQRSDTPWVRADPETVAEETGHHYGISDKLALLYDDLMQKGELEEVMECDTSPVDALSEKEQQAFDIFAAQDGGGQEEEWVEEEEEEGEETIGRGAAP